MRLYDILKRELLDENKKEDVLVYTGETFSSLAECKKAMRENPEKYANKEYELHPEKIILLKPTTQTALRFE